MKAMMLTGIRQFEMQEVPSPKITSGDDVLIRMTTVGVCGSDVHYYSTGRIGSQVVDYPFTVGHEGAGIVEEVGTDVSRVKPGDRIAIEPAVSCWTCGQCRAGRPHTCEHLKFLGCPGQMPGCLSEYIVMPQASCFKIPDNMSLTEAAISEPLSVGLYSVLQSIPMAGAIVGILGAGPIGLSVLIAALLKGAKDISMTDKIDLRLDCARQNGASWTGNPDRKDVVASIGQGSLDVVFECCGKQEALDEAVQLLKPGGKLMLIGIPTVDEVSFCIETLRRNEICIQNVRRQNHCVQPTIDMIAGGDVAVEFMATHRYKFAETPAAFDLVDGYQDGVIKAMVDF